MKNCNNVLEIQLFHEFLSWQLFRIIHLLHLQLFPSNRVSCTIFKLSILIILENKGNFIYNNVSTAFEWKKWMHFSFHPLYRNRKVIPPGQVGPSISSLRQFAKIMLIVRIFISRPFLSDADYKDVLSFRIISYIYYTFAIIVLLEHSIFNYCSSKLNFRFIYFHLFIFWIIYENSLCNYYLNCIKIIEI